MTHVLLTAMVPIFFVMALGYLAGWIRDIDNHHVGELNALVMDFALPASLFVATASTSWATLMAHWPLLVVFIVSMLVLYSVSFLMQRYLFGLGPSESSIQALTISVPSYAAAGLPLIAAMYGPSDVIDVALGMAAGSIVMSPLALAVLEAKANRASEGRETDLGTILEAVGRSLCKPIVIAPVIGVVFSLIGIPLADYVGRSFHLIGQAAGGGALFLTGVILSAQRIELSLSVSSGALLKNVLQPLVALGLVLALPLDRETARAAILLCALPSGFFGVLFSLRYGIESQAGSTLMVTTLISVVTLPVALVLTEGW